MFGQSCNFKFSKFYLILIYDTLDLGYELLTAKNDVVV